MKYLIARFMEWAGLPGLVRPFRFYDPEQNIVIEIKTSRFYTTLKVGNMDFYFDRETGKYDGPGQMQIGMEVK